MMQSLRRKCIYKRSDNFKFILNQFCYGRKKLVADDVMEAIRNEIHDETNILYNYTIPITIPILECILKRNNLMIYKGSLYYIFFKLSGVPFPCNTMKEYNSILNAFNVVSSIYDKYKPKGRTRRAERASNLTFSKCLHLVDLNNPRILMTHDKMAVTANIRA